MVQSMGLESRPKSTTALPGLALRENSKTGFRSQKLGSDGLPKQYVLCSFLPVGQTSDGQPTFPELPLQVQKTAYGQIHPKLLQLKTLGEDIDFPYRGESALRLEPQVDVPWNLKEKHALVFELHHAQQLFQGSQLHKTQLVLLRS